MDPLFLSQPPQLSAFLRKKDVVNAMADLLDVHSSSSAAVVSTTPTLTSPALPPLPSPALSAHSASGSEASSSNSEASVSSSSNTSMSNGPSVEGAEGPAPPAEPMKGWTVAGSAFARLLAPHIFEYLDHADDREKKVIESADPTTLRRIFKELGLPLELDGKVEGCEMDTLLTACKAVMQYSVNTLHPRFMNQLYGHSDPVSCGAEWLMAVLNTNVHTYEVAPVLTLMEKSVIHKMCESIGPNFGATADGLLVPGGSVANIYGMLVARYRAYPECRTRGSAGGPVLVAFVSEQAHYSYRKAAMCLGIGLDNLIAVRCTPEGAMDPTDLEQQIQATLARGHTPFFVGATACTTVTGSFDPVPPLYEICQRYSAGGDRKIWLHVDAAWGGGAFLSPKYRYLLEGTDNADSCTWDAHKMMGVPLQCSAFLLRDPILLDQCNCLSVEYLFQEDRPTAQYDLGSKTIQCGRKGDALKLWLSWHAIGDQGWAERIDRGAAVAEYAVQQINKDPRFQLAFPYTFVNVCFWYLPPSMRASGYDPDDAALSDATVNTKLSSNSSSSSSSAEFAALQRITPLIKAKIVAEGSAMINYQPLGNLPNFFRFVFPASAINCAQDVDFCLDLIARLGDAICRDPAHAKEPFYVGASGNVSQHHQKGDDGAVILMSGQ